MSATPTDLSGWPANSDRLLLMFQALHPNEARTFLAVAASVLPHDHEDLKAARIATALVLDSQMVTNLEVRATTLAGLNELDGLARARYSASFAYITAAQQAIVLAEVESAAFFQGLVHQLKYDFYNRHIVWDVLGYPDLNHEAGYLDHGFDRLDTSPVAPAPVPHGDTRSAHA